MRKSQRVLGVLVSTWMVASLGANAQMNRSRPTAITDGQDLERIRESWRVLEPVTCHNLSVYPVVSNLKLETGQFLTLDEGLASGVVRILEQGQVEGSLYRRRDSRRWPPTEGVRPDFGGANVNELVLVNDSSQPLILLAGEVVSGGKQNRIIGADLVVPPKSSPLPLAVFCVEHGRWSSGTSFGSAKTMAHPEVRMEAQAKKSQAGVWESVSRAAAGLGTASPTSNYQDLVSSPRAEKAFNEIATSLESDYERELREDPRGRNSVGVVVAVDGQLIWTDVFTGQEQFRKYWPKLLRSYVMEAESRPSDRKRVPSAKEAEAFLLEDGGHASVQIEPGAYRRTEISAKNYEVVALEALGKWEDTGLLVHYSKMARDQ